MYLNVSINDRVNLKLSVISIAELRAIQKSITSTGKTIIEEGDQYLEDIEISGNEQVARVISEGDIQVGRASAEADRAEASADEIKSVGVVDPVSSVPLLPNNVPGVPTVTYDDLTGLFTYGIPVGKTGEPAQVITPTGSVTVAELNALVSDPQIGAGYWMLDTGTVTYGDPDVIVTEINSVLIWLADGYFFNLGPLSTGNSWDQIGGVTVEGYAPVTDDDLARSGTAYTKAESDASNGIQDTAIGLNTAKIGVTDEVHSTIGEAGVDAILNMVSCTQAEYDALTPVATTLYVIVGA